MGTTPKSTPPRARLFRTALGLALGLALFLAPGAARAEPTEEDVQAARVAYDRAAEAYKREEYKQAAEDFARADALVPNAVTLELALKSAVLAGDAVLAMTLVERSRREPAEGSLAAAARAARDKYEGEVGRYVVRCPEGATCKASVDGAPVAVGAPSFATRGQHAAVVEVDGEAERRTFEVKPGETVEIVPELEPKAAGGAGGAGAGGDAGDAGEESGLPPFVFWGAAGLTGALAVGAIVSGLDTSGIHGDFEGAATFEEKQALRESGLAAQTRTNVLLGVTLAAGAGTAALGLFFTRWNGKKKAEPAPVSASAALGPRGGFVSLRARF